MDRLLLGRSWCAFWWCPTQPKTAGAHTSVISILKKIFLLVYQGIIQDHHTLLLDSKQNIRQLTQHPLLYIFPIVLTRMPITLCSINFPQYPSTYNYVMYRKTQHEWDVFQYYVPSLKSLDVLHPFNPKHVFGELNKTCCYWKNKQNRPREGDTDRGMAGQSGLYAISK